MTISVGPTSIHSPFSFKPPGITGFEWGHIVSRVDEAELAAFVDANLANTSSANIRRPADGALLTYIAVDPDDRAAALAAGAAPTPSDGKCRAVGFDSNGAIDWEPPPTVGADPSA